MNKLLKLILFFGFGTTVALTGFSQDINFQFRDTSRLVNSFIDIPVRATTTFSGRGVISYSLQFSFNASYLATQGVVTTGTIAEAFGTPTVNISSPGIITIAGAGTTPLTGLGNFIFLRFKILQAGGTNVTNTGADKNYLNEGDPALVFQNSCLVNGIALPSIYVSPGSTIILKGETQQFSASGGAVPYTWSTTNNSVSNITATGLLSTTDVGFTDVKTVDANGYIGYSGPVEIRGYRLSIPDTTGLYNTYIKIPVTVSGLTGLDILSGTFNIAYSQAAVTEIQIETASSLLATVATPIINLSVPGTIQLSFASSSIVSGAGVLFWIKCKLSNPSGSYSGFSFQNSYLNQDLLPITKNGSVNYPAPPGITLSPNSGQLVYGDSLLLTVNGANATAPYVWSVSDTSLASITANRYLKVKRSGQVTLTVTDANSATTTSGVFQLFDTNLKFSCAKVVLGSAIEIPVQITALPTGQGIYSLQGRIYTSNPSLFSLTEIITTGTPAASFSVSSSLGSNYIQFAMAGVTTIPGNSVIFKIKGVPGPSAVAGYISTLSFQDILLNEGTPLPYIQGGVVTAVAVPVIYRFIGNGNWDVPSNWLNNSIPPQTLMGLDEIVIDPAVNGECVLNRAQSLSCSTKFTLVAGKKLTLMSGLNINVTQ